MSTNPSLHFFSSTGEAYDLSQTSDDVHDGDVLVVVPEQVVGVMMKAWPISIETNNHGAFHTAAEPLTAIEGGRYSESYRLAYKVRFGVLL